MENQKIDWEKLPPVQEKQKLKNRIPWSLWIPYQGAVLLVDLLDEAWELMAFCGHQKEIKGSGDLLIAIRDKEDIDGVALNDWKLSRIMEIYLEAAKIASDSAGYGYYSIVADELLSPKFLEVCFEGASVLQPPFYSCHACVFNIARIFCDSLISAAVDQSSDVEDIRHTVHECLQEVILSSESFTRFEPNGWESEKLNAALEREFYYALGNRKVNNYIPDGETFVGENPINKGGRKRKYITLFKMYERGQEAGKWESLKDFYNYLVTENDERIQTSQGGVIKFRSFDLGVKRTIERTKLDE